MTDFTRVLPGAANSAGDNLALFLKLMGGEVITAFKAKTVFEAYHRVRTISNGKSAAFPATGRLSARYVVPGVTQVGQSMNHNERVINVDGELLSDSFIASIDEAMAHWDVRAPISDAMGDALAQAYDQNVARNIALAARAAAVVTGLSGGTVITTAAMDTDATVLAAGLWTAAQTLDEKFIQDQERRVALKPAQFYLAAKTTSLINKDWDGKGSYADGTIQSIAGITIVKSTNVPSADDTANANLPTAYRADYSKTVGLVWTPGAVGTVKLLDLKSEAEYQIRERGWYMVSSYAMGHGILDATQAIELKKV